EFFMAGFARFALIPLALAGAAVPAIAQADASTAGGAMLGSVGGTQLDPLANSLNATVAGAPVKSSGVTQVFGDGLPVRDLPGVAQVLDSDAQAEAAGRAALA